MRQSSAPEVSAETSARYPHSLPIVSITKALLKEDAVSRMASMAPLMMLSEVSTPRQYEVPAMSLSIVEGIPQNFTPCSL